MTQPWDYLWKFVKNKKRTVIISAGCKKPILWSARILRRPVFYAGTWTKSTPCLNHVRAWNFAIWSKPCRVLPGKMWILNYVLCDTNKLNQISRQIKNTQEYEKQWEFIIVYRSNRIHRIESVNICRNHVVFVFRYNTFFL